MVSLSDICLQNCLATFVAGDVWVGYDVEMGGGIDDEASNWYGGRTICL